jgi:hypothetical protein
MGDPALLGLLVDGQPVDGAALSHQQELRVLRIEQSDGSSRQAGVELGLPHLRLLQVRRASVLGKSLKLNVRPCTSLCLTRSATL